MSRKLFVGGLAWATTDDGLRAAFEPFGAVVEAKVVCDRQTGRSRGFGFVTDEDEASAEAARAQLNGATLDGRQIRLDSADDSVKGNSGMGNRRSSGPRRNDSRDDRDDVRRNEDALSAPRRDYSSDDRRAYPAQNYGYIPEDVSRGGRDGRRRDRSKKRRDDIDDDEQW